MVYEPKESLANCKKERNNPKNVFFSKFASSDTIKYLIYC